MSARKQFVIKTRQLTKKPHGGSLGVPEIAIYTALHIYSPPERLKIVCRDTDP